MDRRRRPYGEFVAGLPEGTKLLGLSVPPVTVKAKHTPGPWEYVPSNENHGPYVSNGWGAGDICDCYTMSKPSELAVCNGGTSKPIPFQHDEADANARLIAAAPDLLGLLKRSGEADSADDDIRTAWWEERDAAIAKAEGRS